MIRSQFGLGCFYVGLHVCLFVCLLFFEEGREFRVEGEWDKREETGTKMGTELQCVVVPVVKGVGATSS